MQKTMIMVAPNGARRSKIDHPALPISELETAQEALKCAKAGASVVHAHVRDDEGTHVLDAARYKNLLALVAEQATQTGDDIITQITTEAVGTYAPMQQMACVQAVKPVAVSIALKEIIPNFTFETMAHEFFLWLKQAQVSPQFILYSPEQVIELFQLQEKGVIPFENPFLLFVLGRYAADQQSSPEDLEGFIAALGQRQASWAVCAFGRREAECAIAAARQGGHVRIGFENNLLMPDGKLARDNAALVELCAEQLDKEGLGPMSTPEAGALLKSCLR